MNRTLAIRVLPVLAATLVVGAAVTVTLLLARDSKAVQAVPAAPDPTSTLLATTIAPPATSAPPAATKPPTTIVQCPSLSIGNDGTIAPLLCGGRDNPAALAYYGGQNQRGMAPRVLGLPVTATEQQVVTTICADIAPGSPMGLQTEQQAYQLAATRAGWKYAVNVVNLDCTGQSTTTPPTTAPVLTRCETDMLSATLADTNGAAGTVYSHLVFTNTSSRSCTLAGYPGVSFVDDAGHQIGAPAPRAPGYDGVVTLGPGTSAGAVFALHNAYVGTVDGCQPTQAAGLRVYPPGGVTALFVPAPSRVCANPATDGSASITAVTSLTNLPA